MKNLIWLASYPKSGNTWLRLFLYAYIANRTDINCLGGPGDHGDLAARYYKAVSPGPLEDIPETETLYLRAAALYHLSRQEGDQLVKTHCAKRPLDGLALIPPGLTKGAIYIVRDPRDVAISFAHHLDVSVDHAIGLMREGATLWKDNLCQFLSTWSDHVESWQEAAFPILKIRYEDMLTGEAFRTVIETLLPEVDEDRLAAAIEATAFDKMKSQEEETKFRECSPKADHFFRAGGSTWRDVLTLEQIKKIESDHGTVMRSLGYL